LPPGNSPVSIAFPAARAPRLLVLINGVSVAGAIEATVASNNHFGADRFSTRIALGSNPAAPWASATDFDVNIQFSLDNGTSFFSIIQGVVDTVRIDPLGNTVYLNGRDHTADLMATRMQETFTNQTSSEIAEQIAGRHGFSTDIVATTKPVGRYWQLEHDRTTLNEFSRATTEWDLLVSLARHETFDVWVHGTTLHFRPPDTAHFMASILRPVATDMGPANVTSLSMERNLSVARNIEVVIKSWNSRQQAAFTQTAASTSAAASGVADTQVSYVYVVPNLTPDAALRLAQTKLAEMAQHERVVTVEIPGETSLAPRMQIRLEGTLTDFDQVYWIDEIERHLSSSRGFTQRMRLLRVRPESLRRIA
jgi:phage protein D